jgi:Flp pilus assembly protein TadG
MRHPMRIRSKSESGQAMLEFALVTIFLTFLFAGAFTIGAMLNKALTVSNVTRSAAVLMVRSITDTKADLNLVLTQNQRILIREANGLGMAANANYDPKSNGNGAIFLTKIILVGDTECAAGVTPIPSGVPPWSTATCANYGSYVWAYYVAIGNTTRWASAYGTPQSSDIRSDGTVSAHDIATDTAVQIPANLVTSAITLVASQYALVSETYADVSSISLFSIYQPPVIYYRTIT